MFSDTFPVIERPLVFTVELGPDKLFIFTVPFALVSVTLKKRSVLIPVRFPAV